MTRFEKRHPIGRSCPGAKGAEILRPTGKLHGTACSALTDTTPTPVHGAFFRAVEAAQRHTAGRWHLVCS